MKKLSVICLGLAFGVLTLSSCTKEYNCTCKVTLSDGTVNTYGTTITATKKNKQSECEESAPYSDFGKTCTVD